MPPGRSAFTLIELLVVVTIIVLLLALLVPAMEKAIYEAELSVCATRLKAVGASAAIYAFDHNRAYPKVGSPFYPENGRVNKAQPATLRQADWDLRPLLSKMFDMNAMLNCPLNDDVEFDTTPPVPTLEMWADYNLYFGWQFQGQRGMNRLGDSFSGPYPWGVGSRFRILAADRDLVMPGRPELQSSHPDRDGVMYATVAQDGPAPWGQLQATISLWITFSTYERGEIDQNFVYDDGSVNSMRGVKPDEARLVKVPIWAEASEFGPPGAAYSQLPDR